MTEDEELSRAMLEEARRDGVAAYHERVANMMRWGVEPDSPIGELMLAGAVGTYIIRGGITDACELGVYGDGPPGDSTAPVT